MTSKNDLVVKSNRLVEACYRLTLAEQRIILYAITEARRTQDGLSEATLLSISAADYAAMYDLELKQAYEQIKEAADTLFGRYVLIHGIHPETGKPELAKLRWVSTVKYVDGSGIIQLRFAHDMIPFITQLKARFTRYKLEKVAQMSSIYAIRLYELLMQWISQGRREVEIEWLKQTLAVEDEYPRLFDFKKRVIDVAVAQINQFSDLTVSYTQRKTGRNVSHLIFEFALKEGEPGGSAKADEAPQDSPLYQRLRGLGIGARLAAGWVRQDAGRVAAVLDYVEAKARAGEVRGKAAGYLRTVFESGGDIPGPDAVTSPAAPARKIGGVAVSEIEKHARPGETYQDAAVRLSKQAASRSQP